MRNRNCPHCGQKKGVVGTLCSACIKLPKCEVCQIIFGKSEINRKRCKGCEFAEQNMKQNCINDNSIIERQDLRYFSQHGNFCNKCITRINNNLKGS